MIQSQRKNVSGGISGMIVKKKLLECFLSNLFIVDSAKFLFFFSHI